MLHTVRRFRRRLLLPIGWVALGLLLPLSCWLLGRQPKQWRRENVVQMTMPPLRPNPSNRDSYVRMDSTEYNPWAEADGPRLVAKLARMRPWRNFTLYGDTAADSARLSDVEAAVKAIQADTGHAGGVRVRLGRQIAYRELIALLDMMSRLDQKKYWLDIVHQPITFYAITNRPPTLAERRQDKEAGYLSFGPCIVYTQLPPPAGSLADNLRQPERRPQLLLTVTIIALLLAALAATLTLALGLRR